MYKSKQYQPAYNSKEIFMLYIFKINFFLYLNPIELRKSKLLKFTRK